MKNFSQNKYPIERKVGESIDDYEFRLFRDKEILNLTYEEIATLMNFETGQDFSESAYRKRTLPKVHMYNEMYPKVYAEVLSDLDKEENPLYLQKKDERYVKLLKAKVQTQDQNRIFNNAVRKEARADHIVQTFQQVARLLSDCDPIQFIKPEKKNLNNKAGVLLLSDWHYGLSTENIFGKYNPEILKTAIEELTFDVIEKAKSEELDKLVVLNLGDLINGNIHVSTRVESEENAVQQILEVSTLLKKMLYEFSKVIPSVEFHSVTDNHARINKIRQEHIEDENFNVIIPYFLSSWFKDIKNVEIVSNTINGVDGLDIGLFNLFGSDMIFTHGHNGRINNTIQDLSLMLKVFPETVFTAHLHHSASNEVHSIDHIQNPALAITDSYAISIRKSSRQRQKLIIYNNNNDKAELESVNYISPNILNNK